MTTFSDYADDKPADLWWPDRPDAVDGTLAPQIISALRSEGRLSSEKDLEFPEPTGRSFDGMIATTNDSKAEYGNDPHDLDVTPTGTTIVPIVVRCQACSKEFKGSPVEANSNFRRHLRETPRHNKNAGLRCPQPECRTRRPMRSDNLKPHLMNIHRITSASERQRILDECRSSVKRTDHNGDSGRKSLG